MLILAPGLMANMDDVHLLRALDCEHEILRTSVELELMRRLDKLVGKETPEEIESRYESALEQSELRAQLIQEIVALCDEPGSKKDLVAAIKSALENSYVEL